MNNLTQSGKDVKGKYWVQALWVIICPDGTAYDYPATRKAAIKLCKELNKKG